MAIERKNPLPVGKYWVDVFDPHINDFKDWLDKNKDSVIIDKQEYYIARDNYPQRNWYLFHNTAPVDWQGPGFPTIAEQETHTSEDTAQKPPPEPSGVEVIEDAFSKAGNILTLAGLAVGGILLYKVFSK